MNRVNIVELVEQIFRSNTITADDVLALRRSVFGDERVWPHEADALFALSQKRLDAAPEWHEFFIEAMTDYLVNQEEPHGYVSEDNARWLMGVIHQDGAVWSDTEVELLVHILDKARSSPPSLVQFALNIVKEEVLTGQGPTRRGMNLSPGSIGAGEVDLLRRILYAYGGASAGSICREEAEILFEINDATLSGDNDPAWQDFFVKAIANHVMALSGYRAPSRQEALRREEWLSDTSVSVGGFFSRMASGWRDVFATYEAPQEDLDLDRAIAERINEGEALWLCDRILKNGQVCPNQQALLQFIRDESPDIHPDLKPLLDQAA